jgi:hypothetical protein
MDKKELDAIMFAVNEKANDAYKRYQGYLPDTFNRERTEFWKGQHKAFTEVYTLLSNTKERLEKE